MADHCNVSSKGFSLIYHVQATLSHYHNDDAIFR